MNGEASDPIAKWRAKRDGSVVLDGFHAIKHALRFGAEVSVVLTADPVMLAGLAADLAPDVAEPLERLASVVPAEELAAVVPRPHPTRVAALAARPRQDWERPRRAPVVVLDNPRHLGNAGAVVRLAAGFDVSGVLTTGDMDPWHPAVVRAAAGLHFATTVGRVSDTDFPDGPVVVLDAAGEDLRRVVIPDDAVLVFGSERHGVSPGVRARAQRVVSLPMRSMVSSYNLATSVAMTLYAWAAQSDHIMK